MHHPSSRSARSALRLRLVTLCFPALVATATHEARSQAPAPQILHTDADWLLPIRGAGDDPLAASYGLWASGPDYKASFGKTIAFYPLLGEAGENAPLRWTTRSIAIGERELLRKGEEPRAEHSDWRYTLHHPGVDEIYAVTSAGLEQSFVLHERPSTGGDLVIEGAIESALVAAEQEPAHGAIAFGTADGAAVVSYGAALAIDAAGRSTPMRSRFANGAIHLHLDGAWLATASFPLVVDPLFARFDVSVSGQVVGGVDISAQGEHQDFLVARERLFAIGDFDLFASVVGMNGAALASSFTDIAAGWSTLHPSGAHIGGSDKWVLAFERFVGFPASADVYAFLQDDSGAAPPGVVRVVSNPAGTHQRYPAIGGVRSLTTGDIALVVYQEDTAAAATDTEESRIRGALLDASTATFAPSFAISIDAAGHDCERPAVSRISTHEFDPWLVVYQQWNAANANDDWDVIGRLVRSDGALSNREIVAAASSGEHALLPKVDGTSDRFLVVHGASDNTQKSYGEKFPRLRAQRVNWDFFDPAPSFPSARRLLRSSPLDIYGFGRAASRPLAYDYDSRSHWGLAWIESDRLLRGARLGYDAGIVETSTLYSQAGDTVRSASVAFDYAAQRMAFVFGVLDAAGTNPVYKRDLGFANAFNFTYGATCAGTINALGSNGGPAAPWAGSEFFYLGLDGGAPFAPTALLLALAPGNLPLGNGCTLLLDPTTFFVVASGGTNSAGEMNVHLPLVTTPFYEYDLYWQWLQIDPGSGQPTLTSGLRTFIR